MDTKWFYYPIIIVVGYLVGSLNFANIFSKLKKKDIRKEGSGNPGTMNMLRSVGIAMGLLTLFSDILKAVLVAVMGLCMAGDFGLYLGGVMCIFGHNYSCFLKFKGGKGVASCIGIFMVANPIAGLVGFVLLLIYLFSFKYGSIGSLLLVVGLGVTEIIILRNSPEVIMLIFCIVLLIVFAHRKNIIRVLQGKENKLELVKYIKSAKEKSRQKKLANAVSQPLLENEDISCESVNINVLQNDNISAQNASNKVLQKDNVALNNSSDKNLQSKDISLQKKSDKTLQNEESQS